MSNGTLPPKEQQRLLWAWMDRTHFLSVAGSYLATRSPDDANSILKQQQLAVAARETLKPLNSKPIMTDLPAAENEYLAQVKQSPFFQRNFAGLTTSFGYVQPSDLIVFQHFVNGKRVDAPSDVLRWCLPKEFNSQAQIVFDGGHKVLFVTEDDTSIFAVNIDPQRGPSLGLQPRGNWFQVARVENKLILRNGMHRAAILAAAGHTKIPALIVDFGTLREVVPGDPGFFNANYLEALKRPPVVTDFLNPAVTIDIPRQQTRRVVAVKLEVDEYRIPIT